MSEAQKKENVVELEEQLKALRKDVASLASLIAGQAEATMSRSAKSVRSEAEELLNTTRAASDAAAKKTREAVDSIEAHIAEKPVQSVLVALLVGFLVGALSRR
jgi:ElaB/YqjD/DUF883 family membrane-anchored ribosome-binding protein